MSYRHRQKHGNIQLGRAVVAVAAFLILGVDWLIYRQDARTPFPFPGLQLYIIISIIWFIAGVIGLCMRQPWGRVMALTILSVGALALFATAIMIIGGAEDQMAVRLKPLSAAILIYFVAGLVIAKSKHIRRLTSRTWE
jgi:hypothetical protein